MYDDIQIFASNLNFKKKKKKQVKGLYAVQRSKLHFGLLGYSKEGPISPTTKARSGAQNEIPSPLF